MTDDGGENGESVLGRVLLFLLTPGVASASGPASLA